LRLETGKYHGSYYESAEEGAGGTIGLLAAPPGATVTPYTMKIIPIPQSNSSQTFPRTDLQQRRPPSPPDEFIDGVLDKPIQKHDILYVMLAFCVDFF
jgi:hypothetical protein